MQIKLETGNKEPYQTTRSSGTLLLQSGARCLFYKQQHWVYGLRVACRDPLETSLQPVRLLVASMQVLSVSCSELPSGSTALGTNTRERRDPV